MLKLGKRKWLIMAICIASMVVALAIVSLFIQVYADVCTKNEYTAQKECQTYHIAPFILLYVAEFLEAHNGALTAIATGFIAWFTLSLRRATNQQARITDAALKLARDEFNATHRPKLRVRRMKPHPAGTPVRVQYVMVNVGETTAIIKRHDITLCIQPDGSGAKQTLQSSSLECPQLKGGESRPFWKNIDTQYDYGWGIASSTLKIRGIVEYEDGAGTTRRTGFLRTYDVKLGRFHASYDKEEEYED